MSDAFTVGAEARIVSASPAEQATVTNGGGSTVYYKKTSDVGVSSNDGSLTKGESLTLTAPKWFITAPTGSSKLFIEHAPDEQTDPATQAELDELSSSAVRGSDRILNPTATNPLLADGSSLLIGSNVIPTPTQTTEAAGSGKSWAVFWQDIAKSGKSSSTWEWVKKQIDAFAGSSTEGKAIRIIGCVGGIGQGYYSRAQYVAAWKIVSDYCREKSLLLYPALNQSWKAFGPADYSAAAFPSSTDIADIASVAVSLSRFGNVVGFDVVQEYNGNYPSGKNEANAIAALKEVFTAIRAAGCLTPLTSSRPVFSSSGWETTAVETESEFMDFIDKHIWYGLTEERYDVTPAANDQANIYPKIGEHMPIVLGEAGISSAASTEAQRKAYYEALLKLLRGGKVVGCFQWAIADQSEESASKYGMFSGKPSESLTARTELTNIYKTWPRRRQATGTSRYLEADVEVKAEETKALTGLTLEFNHGALANTGGFTIPKGLGGLWHFDLSLMVYAGTEAGSVVIWLGKASESSVVKGPESSIPFAKEDHITINASKTCELEGGDEVRFWVFATKKVTAKGGATFKNKSFISFHRVAPTTF